MMAKNAPDMAWMRCVGITMGFPVEGLPVDISSRLTAFHALRKKLMKMALAMLSTGLSALRIIFAPKLLVKRLLLVASLQVFAAIIAKLYRILHFIYYELGSRQHSLRREMKKAPSYAEWAKLAKELDEVVGNEKWKTEKQSPCFDHELIEQKTELFNHLMQTNDAEGLMWHLRKGLLRRQGGVGHADLFSRSHVGTKYVVEEYIDQVCKSLRFVLYTPLVPYSPAELRGEDSTEEMILKRKLRFFLEMRHSLGRSALLLSGGITLGMYHLGVVKALHTNGLLPRVISGSSAGSIVAAVVGSVTDEEMPNIFVEGYLNLNFFEKKEAESKQGFMSSSFARRTKRFFTQGTLLDINVLKHTLQANLGDITFLEAYQRTGRIVNISVTPASKNEYPTLLNYLTAPHVLMWSACLASCAIPFVFESVALMAKDKSGNIVTYYPEGLTWQDGSLELDLPMVKLAEMFNVNHFIVSQVNPHVIPFSTIGWELNPLTKLIHFTKAELKHYAQNVAAVGLPGPISSVLSIFTQKYEGDITIKPLSLQLKSFQGLLSNPTSARVAAAIREGELETWKHLSIIKNHCDIEFTINECIGTIKSQLQAVEGREGPRKTLAEELVLRREFSAVAIPGHDMGSSYYSYPRDESDDDSA